MYFFGPQIRNSGDSVTVVVQPVAELVELSRRCMAPTEEDDEVEKATLNVSDCNTLRRSASKRFKVEVSGSFTSSNLLFFI